MVLDRKKIDLNGLWIIYERILWAEDHFGRELV